MAKLTVDPDKGGSGDHGHRFPARLSLMAPERFSSYADGDDSTASVLKDVHGPLTGRFRRPVAAKDLVKAADTGVSVIMIVDADGGEATDEFKVTGTTTLGSDSVGKGEFLKNLDRGLDRQCARHRKDRWHPPPTSWMKTEMTLNPGRPLTRIEQPPSM